MATCINNARQTCSSSNNKNIWGIFVKLDSKVFFLFVIPLSEEGREMRGKKRGFRDSFLFVIPYVLYPLRPLPLNVRLEVHPSRSVFPIFSLLPFNARIPEAIRTREMRSLLTILIEWILFFF